MQYTVTAQNKSQQVYTVTVKVADKPTDPPEKDKLYRIRNNILASYKTTQADRIMTVAWSLTTGC